MGHYTGHDFFHPNNREGTTIRNKCALDALQVNYVELLSIDHIIFHSFIISFVLNIENLTYCSNLRHFEVYVN